MREKARVPPPASAYPRVPPAQPPRWLGREGPRGKGVEEVLSPHLHLVSPPSSQAQDHPAPRQSMRDGCWGRSDVCNADKMSAILNGSGDAAVGGLGEGERAEQGGERKGK